MPRRTTPHTPGPLEIACAQLDELDREELRDLHREVIVAMRQLDRLLAEEFAVGDRVSFEDRYGETHTGTVAKVNAKTATVHGTSRYPRGVRVPCGMLSPA